ncbi:MAG: radical SAM protein [Eubacteriales bacterium]
MGSEVTSRYSIIEEKNKREIVLLRGKGCSWRRCRFCDYHLDFSFDQEENDVINQSALAKVTGIYGKLEVINSGSFADLSNTTMKTIEETCLLHNITELHFESHYAHRDEIPKLKERFAKKGITVKLKIGVETFDTLFRECYLDKGITTDNPAEIAEYFDACCLLQGIPGQTIHSMEQDILIGLQYFDRVCVNIMVENTSKIKPDPRVINDFITYIYPQYIENERIDILIENTDFGVGGLLDNE